MKEWYLEHTPPEITSGYESDVISEYAQNNFTDLLETDFADTIILYNSDLSESKEVKCVIQGNTADTKLNSLQRSILFPIGTSVAGKYVFFENGFWLIYGKPGNNKSYEKVIAYYCSFQLRCQNKEGKIISRYVYSEDQTKYSTGEIGNNNITVGDNQYGLYIPIDNETKALNRDMRFVVDFADAIVPDVYKLTNKKTIISNYEISQEGGTMILTLSYDAFNKDTDKLIELTDGSYSWICNYFNSSTKASDDLNVSTDDIMVSIIGGDSLKCGKKKTWKVNFSNLESNKTTTDNYNWNIISNFNIKKTIKEDSIELLVDDSDLIGCSFMLQIIICDKVMSEIEITITDIY